MIDVVATFGADPTGATDATAALQKALTAARTTNVSLLVPFGCYRVTETLNATQPRNGRWQPIVIFGQQQASPSHVQRQETQAPVQVYGSGQPIEQ